jgi:eukaryotic-like serine/threonine-protein kinase
MHPTFGRYELLKRLAGGGMGEVYLARQRGIDGFQKLLVIKTLLPHLCEDEEFIVMFKDEARVTAGLIHPNICQVFEFEQVDGIYYMAMEYLRGEDLRRLWKACEQNGTPLTVPFICRIVSDAAAGLDFAHGLRNSEGQPYGIVHRDISPQNLFVTFEGGVKVIDFGVAKAAGRSQHTRTGALKGKYSYMSPEQVAGENVDNRSDIFALGIVLHELLTGHRLFKADSDVQTLARVRDCVVPPPSQLNPRLPAGLDAIVLKALAKNPDDRFRTAQELRLALEDWLTQGRMSASSAHLAEFLKLVYAGRLSKEARLGPLLGEDGFSGPAPGASITPASVRTPAARQGEATRNERTPAGTRVSELDPGPAQATASSFGKPRRLWVAIAGAVAAVAVAIVIVSRPVSGPAPASAPAAAIAEATPAPVPEPQKAAPAVHLVTLETLPEGAQVFEGSRYIGKTPKIWSDAGEGAHELRFTHDGYREETASVVVSRDGQELSFKLHKLEVAKRATPELGIKAER